MVAGKAEDSSFKGHPAPRWPLGASLNRLSLFPPWPSLQRPGEEEGSLYTVTEIFLEGARGSTHGQPVGSHCGDLSLFP